MSDTPNIEHIELDAEKEKRIKKEQNRLRALLRNNELDSKTISVLESTIANVAFLAILLEDLQKDIKEKGYTEIYRHGKGVELVREAVAVRTYNGIIKSYNTLIRTLQGFLPKANKKEAGNDMLAGFLMKK